MSEDVDTRLSAEQKEAVRWLVSANAVDAKGSKRITRANRGQMVADAEELMMMLGVHPTQNDDEYLTGPPDMINSPSRDGFSPTWAAFS